MQDEIWKDKVYKLRLRTGNDQAGRIYSMVIFEYSKDGSYNYFYSNGQRDGNNYVYSGNARHLLVMKSEPQFLEPVFETVAGKSVRPKYYVTYNLGDDPADGDALGVFPAGHEKFTSKRTKRVRRIPNICAKTLLDFNITWSVRIPDQKKPIPFTKSY